MTTARACEQISQKEANWTSSHQSFTTTYNMISTKLRSQASEGIQLQGLVHSNGLIHQSLLLNADSTTSKVFFPLNISKCTLFRYKVFVEIPGNHHSCLNLLASHIYTSYLTDLSPIKDEIRTMFNDEFVLKTQLNDKLRDPGSHHTWRQKTAQIEVDFGEHDNLFSMLTTVIPPPQREAFYSVPAV